MTDAVGSEMIGDFALIAQAQAGDQGAFSRLMQGHALRAYRIAYVIVSNHHDAEDVVQDAFLIAYRSLGALRQTASFGAWLDRIVANRARDLVRQRQAQRRREQAALPVERAGDIADADDAASLRTAIHNLPEQHRIAVLLYYSGELTTAEVADIMQVPPGTVRRLLSEAYARLRTLLGGQSDA